MKSTLGILFVLFSLTSFAQFPAPSNFVFTYDYITIDDIGYCEGQTAYGPTYCSQFSWTVADINSTNAVFDHYNLYYYNYWGSQDTTILASTTEAFIEMEIGIMGELWITAVYSNPIGESEPSNIEINSDLPISIDENLPVNNINVFYDKNHQEIRIKNGEDISHLNVFDSQGKLVKSESSNKSSIKMNYLPQGLYIVEIHMNNQETIREKIIK